jgi:hypothetical protein
MAILSIRCHAEQMCILRAPDCIDEIDAPEQGGHVVIGGRTDRSQRAASFARAIGGRDGFAQFQGPGMHHRVLLLWPMMMVAG